MKYAKTHQQFLIASLILGVAGTMLVQSPTWVWKTNDFIALRIFFSFQHGLFNGLLFYLFIGQLIAKMFSGPKPETQTLVQPRVPTGSLLEQGQVLPEGATIMNYREIHMPDGRVIKHGEAVKVERR
jgi:hypothetical protein